MLKQQWWRIGHVCTEETDNTALTLTLRYVAGEMSMAPGSVSAGYKAIIHR